MSLSKGIAAKLFIAPKYNMYVEVAAGLDLRCQLGAGKGRVLLAAATLLPADPKFTLGNLSLPKDVWFCIVSDVEMIYEGWSLVNDRN